MPANSWTSEQRDFLIQNYSSSTNKELEQTLGKRIGTIKEYGRRLNLQKEYDVDAYCRNGSLSPLLAETPQAYYWIGFIMADGHLSKSNRLVVSSSWDEEHIAQLATFLGTKAGIKKRSINSGNFAGSRDVGHYVSISDKVNAPLIRNKFNLHNNKTYVSPDLSFLSDDWKLYSFLIGFIDGDGTINQKTIIIGNHIGWKEVYHLLTVKLLKYKPVVFSRTDKAEMIYIRFSSTLFYDLNQFAENTKLVVLQRKWRSKLSNFVWQNKNFHTLKDNKEDIVRYLKDGKTYQEIADILKCSYAGLSKFCLKHNINIFNRNKSWGSHK